MYEQLAQPAQTGQSLKFYFMKRDPTAGLYKKDFKEEEAEISDPRNIWYSGVGGGQAEIETVLTEQIIFYPRRVNLWRPQEGRGGFPPPSLFTHGSDGPSEESGHERR